MINTKHLKKKFEASTPLKDINLTINKCDVASIIIPFGTIKSTNFRYINLLEKTTSGNIIIDGERIVDKNAYVFKIQNKLGIVFQFLIC